MKKMKWDDKSVECIVCDKPLDMKMMNPDEGQAKNIIHGMGPWQGVQCQTSGNYGSQVFDMEGTIYFALCDECLVRKSNKMLKARHFDCHKCRDDSFKEGEGIDCARDYFENWHESFSKSEHSKDDDEYTQTIGAYFK